MIYIRFCRSYKILYVCASQRPMHNKYCEVRYGRYKNIRYDAYAGEFVGAAQGYLVSHGTKFGRNFILWMMEEMGECIAIIKKKGDSAIMREASVREAFVEEMSDVLMYYFDTLLRYGVTPEEISNAYVAKHNKNMGRDYQREYNNKYTK